MLRALCFVVFMALASRVFRALGLRSSRLSFKSSSLACRHLVTQPAFPFLAMSAIFVRRTTRRRPPAKINRRRPIAIPIARSAWRSILAQICCRHSRGISSGMSPEPSFPCHLRRPLVRLPVPAIHLNNREGHQPSSDLCRLNLDDSIQKDGFRCCDILALR